MEEFWSAKQGESCDILEFQIIYCHWSS